MSDKTKPGSSDAPLFHIMFPAADLLCGAAHVMGEGSPMKGAVNIDYLRREPANLDDVTCAECRRIFLMPPEEAIRLLDEWAAKARPSLSEADPEPRWRVGRKLGRTLYRDGQVIGMVDTRELASAIVEAMNERES